MMTSEYYNLKLRIATGATRDRQRILLATVGVRRGALRAGARAYAAYQRGSGGDVHQAEAAAAGERSPKMGVNVCQRDSDH